MGLRWVLASAAALVAAAIGCAPAGAIVGGTAVPIQAHPYQVALVDASKTAVNGQFCGGSIRDATHIITAAHCVLSDSTGQPKAPGTIDVLAGVANLENEGTGQRLAVAPGGIAFDPDYDSGTLANDAALITLATPLTLNQTKQPIGIIDDDDWADVTGGTPLFVTGWGGLGNHTYPDELQGVSVNYITDHDCTTTYFWPAIANDSQVCAAAPHHDTCDGDSGGPLVRAIGASTPADDRLAGIVSGGDQVCANPLFPGLYTEVSNPTIRAFLQQGFPVAAPVSRSAPALVGGAAVGSTLTCGRGRWTGSPSFRYQFIRSTTAGVDVAIVADSASATYVVSAGEAGMTVRCRVLATNAGGTSSVETSRLAIPGAATPQQPQLSLDTTAPVARVTKTKCTTSRCTLLVSVTDLGFSSGIKTVQASVTSTYKTTCRKKGRKRTCTKTKTGRATVKKLAASRFQVVASRLPVGKQVFTLVAIDQAGHRQRLATKKTVTTKKPKKKSKHR